MTPQVIRVIDELELYEISLVDNPANPEAMFTVVKRDMPQATEKALPGGYEAKRRAVQAAVDQACGSAPDGCVSDCWVVDFDDARVIYQTGADAFSAPYFPASDGAVKLGVPVKVVPVTTYEPAAPADPMGSAAALTPESPATILAGAPAASASPALTKGEHAVDELMKTIEGLGLSPEQLESIKLAKAHDLVADAIAKGDPVSLIDQISTLVSDPQASAGLAALRDVLSSGSSSSSSSSDSSSSSSTPFSRSSGSKPVVGTVSSSAGSSSSGSSSSPSSGSTGSTGSTGPTGSSASSSGSSSGSSSSGTTPSSTSTPSSSGSSSSGSGTPFSKDAPPAGPQAPAGVANTNVGVGNNAAAGTSGPSPAGFNVQELANGIVAALRSGVGSNPAVPNPVMKGEDKPFAENVPVQDIAKAAKATADPTKEAVKDALLGDDRTHALEKALKACGGDYSLFTKYQQELSREVVIDDANTFFGGFATLHNIQVGR